MKNLGFIFAVISFWSFYSFAQAAKHEVPDNRIASVFLSQDFMNQQLNSRAKSQLIKELSLKLDSDKGRLLLLGTLQVPTEELRAINLDPKMGVFRFQFTIQPRTTKKGYLILEFPLNETFFYPAGSKNPERDRVIVPVQMLSLALASVRGYLAALSGDFSGFDRRTEKINALLKAANRSIALEKNPDALEEMKNARDALKLQLAAVPIERKQLQALSKQVEGIFGFTGEKEMNLNNELGARQNSIIFKIKLGQLLPYLSGITLGGVRVINDKKDGGGQHYLVIDVNSDLSAPVPPKSQVTPAPRQGMKIAPDLIVRLNQSLFESEAVLSAEKTEMGSKLKDMDMQLKDDGLHVNGKYNTFFFSIPFETIVDFMSTKPDVFEVRVRDLNVAGLDLDFLTGFVLEAMKKRLNHALKGICHFKYVGEQKDKSRALQVTVDTKALVPAFPNLHLIDVDIREREFLLKIGEVAP